MKHIVGTYSIKDLENLSGIKAHTLRIWEQRYSIIAPKRTPTKIRYYNDQDLQQLLNIAFLNRNGHKISKIARMSANEIKETVLNIANSSLESSNQLNALVIAMVDLDEARFEKILATNSLQFGFEYTMVELVYPFLERVGILWQTGSINPAHEHFITNLIRQKLIVAIDGQIRTTNPNADKYVLFLPEGELHEISLLFSALVLKSRQNEVIYLGQSLPLVDLESIVKTYEPNFVLTVITSYPASTDVPAYLKAVEEKCPKSKVLVSGYQVLQVEESLSDNIIVFQDLHDFILFADRQSHPDKHSFKD